MICTTSPKHRHWTGLFVFWPRNQADFFKHLCVLQQYCDFTQLLWFWLINRPNSTLDYQLRDSADKLLSLQAADEDIPPTAAHPAPLPKPPFCHVCWRDNDGQPRPQPPQVQIITDTIPCGTDTNNFSQQTWTKSHKQWRGKLSLQITKQMCFTTVCPLTVQVERKDFSSCFHESMSSQEKLPTFWS